VESTVPRTTTDWGGQYAYHFWVPSYPGLDGFFHTLGAFGQVVYVNRALELVVVFTAELPNETANSNFQGLISEFIVPALH
jgi:CubicO group peptidase (beta-lactamase class C family)